MPLTGQLGTSLSQPGSIQPGFVFTGVAVYQGPPAYVAAFNKKLVPGSVVTGVSGAVASQLAAGDLTWWVFH